MLQKWLTKMFWKYLYFLNSIVAIIIIPAKQSMIHMASKIGSTNNKNWSLIHFCMIGRRFSFIFLAACFPWSTWVMNCKAFSSFSMFLLGMFFFKFWLTRRLVTICIMCIIISFFSASNNKSKSRSSSLLI